MKRSDIIKKLVSEGISEKTLVNFTDNQLKLLSNRLIKEQMLSPEQKLEKDKTINVEPDNPDLKSVQDMARQKKWPVKVSEVSEETIDISPKNKNEKIISFQSKTKEFDTENLPYEVVVPEHLPFQLSNGNFQHSYCVTGNKEEESQEEGDSIEQLYEVKNWIQKAIKKPGSLKKSLGVKKDEKIPSSKLNAASKKGGKIGEKARLAKTLKSFHETKNWVEKLVEQDNSTMTTKNEIIKLVKMKLKEQAEPIAPPKPKEPITRPGTRPNTKPERRERPGEDDDPYVDPFEPAHGPGTEPKFKTNGNKLSNDFKLKILSLVNNSKSDFISSSLNENKKPKNVVAK